MNLKYNKRLTFIFGLLLMIIGISAFKTALTMYPIEGQLKGFYQLFAIVIVVTGIIVFLLWRFSRLRKLSIRIDLYLLMLLSGLTIVLGHTFTYSEKTDEFLLYFLSIHILLIGVILAIVRIFFYLFEESKQGDIYAFLLAGIGGVIVGFVVDYLFVMVFSEIFKVYFVVLMLMILVIPVRDSSKSYELG